MLYLKNHSDSWWVDEREASNGTYKPVRKLFDILPIVNDGLGYDICGNH